MATPVKIIAILTALPGQASALRALLDDMTTATRSEPGNLRYDLWRDQADESRYVLDELYVDQAAVTAHRQSVHFQDYLERINDLAERLALTLDPLTAG